ncbi:MAG TPA: DALR domain-containing protein, partial [Candidatus Limnocylindrales bacterium]|nr:DALR domain-containing protein [Candidatus Limnocylindrales bacterium]
TGKPFVGTWLHCAHLRLAGQKMARRVGNIYSVAELLEAGVSPRALRLALISVHYRQSLDYTDDSLPAAAAALERLDALLAALAVYAESRPDDPELPSLLDEARAGFEAAMDNDLHGSTALASVFELVREVNRRVAERILSTADAERVVRFLREIDAVLAILPDEAQDLPAGAPRLLEARLAARAAHDWAASDRLRDELAELGVAVEDTRDGQRWRLLERAR